MAQHARTAILAAFHSAFANLVMQPRLFKDGLSVDFESLPAVSVFPGEEPRESATHDAGYPTQRRLKVYVVCSAVTQELADELSAEVESAAPYDEVGAQWAGVDFAASEEGEKKIFKTRVSFDVIYEVSVS